MKHNQRGFGIVEALVLLVLLLLILLGGWYMWKKQKPSRPGSTANSQQQDQAQPASADNQQPADPAADWATYTNQPGKFRFKHPKSWVFAEHPELCAEGLVLFAANASSVGKCASELGGQMLVAGAAGDGQAEHKLNIGFTDIAESNATADGVSGIKQVATASGQEGPGMLPDGTKVVKYIFFTNNTTYAATYTQAAGYPDVLSDFDHLVTKTLKFL